MEDLSAESALSNVRVLDFTHMIAGPFAAFLLSAFGAEVIKIESAYHPDRFRKTKGDNASVLKSSIAASRIFEEFNRNKKSITLNMATPEARQLARKLVCLSDVVLENYSLGTMEKWEMGYEDLRKVNPAIIMCSMQGMGRTGPWRHYVTWGPTLLAYAGFTYLWNHDNLGEPVGSQISFPDYMAAVQADIAIMAALQYRQRTGMGRFIELSQVESTLSLLPTTFLEYFVNRKEPLPQGNRSSFGSPSGCYRCQGNDRWCVIVVENEQDWERFCRAIGNPAWSQDHRFATAQDRLHHTEEIDHFVEEWTRTRTPHEIMEVFQEAGILAGAVQNAQDLCHDPNLSARHILLASNNPALAGILLPGMPVKLSHAPANIGRHAPYLGEDNEYIFRNLLGMSEEEIKALLHIGALM